MAFRRESCVILLCDACGTDTDDGGDVGVIHWSSEDEALREWSAPMCSGGLSDDDCESPRVHVMPDGRVLCLRCAHKSLCVDGHVWSGWLEWLVSSVHMGNDSRYRSCERCGEHDVERRPARGDVCADTGYPHAERCCPTHGTHSLPPHRGCILR